MKISLERSHLLKALAHVQRVVEKRNTYPILSNVLIQTGEGEILMRATDLDIEITENVPASIQSPGSTTVPAHKLYEIVRKLSDGSEVRLDTEGSDGEMSLASGRARFKLACLSPETFPDLKSGSFPSNFRMQAALLKDMLDRTAFAASTEETRYYLNGVFFHTLEGQEPMLRAVATDGHRLARCAVAAPDGTVRMPDIIVPRKTVSELQKLLDGLDAEISVEVSDTKIRVDLGGIVLLSKLIEGTFPDYERVTPRHNELRLLVDRQDFQVAVDRVSTIASDRGGKAVKLSAADGVLVLSVNNPDHGAAVEEIQADFEGSFEVAFNARYLMDIVSQVRAEQVEFMFGEATSPALVRDGADENTVYVLMPMRA
jgi:DNA polymerase III, beta subunit